ADGDVRDAALDHPVRLHVPPRGHAVRYPRDRPADPVDLLPADPPRHHPQGRRGRAALDRGGGTRRLRPRRLRSQRQPLPQDARLMATAVEARALTKVFGDLVAVDRLTLEVATGE